MALFLFENNIRAATELYWTWDRPSDVGSGRRRKQRQGERIAPLLKNVDPEIPMPVPPRSQPIDVV
jgi:hypothetical protein